MATEPEPATLFTEIRRGDWTYSTTGYLKCSVWLNNGKRVETSQHREIMEKHLGRKLHRNEVVHHKDGVRDNNDITNLCVMTRAEHVQHHAKGISYVDVICGMCDLKFTRKVSEEIKRKKKGQRGPYCSRSCAAAIPKPQCRKPIPHNTTNGYGRGCRCRGCTDANSKKSMLYRRRCREEKHILEVSIYGTC